MIMLISFSYTSIIKANAYTGTCCNYEFFSNAHKATGYDYVCI